MGLKTRVEKNILEELLDDVIRLLKCIAMHCENLFKSDAIFDFVMDAFFTHYLKYISKVCNVGKCILVTCRLYEKYSWVSCYISIIHYNISTILGIWVFILAACKYQYFM